MIDHFLDIYSKLEIGVISFLAPVTSYLLSTFISDRTEILKRLNEQIDTIDNILEDDLREGSKKNLPARKILRDGNTRLRDLEKNIKKKADLLKYLEPKTRIIWIFSSLFISISLLLFDSLVRGNVFNMYNHRLSVLLLVLSCGIFFYSIYLLGKIALRLIDAKQLLVEERKEIANTKNSIPVQQSND